MFGGTVELVDCFVAHWFKNRFQYVMPSQVLLKNKSRIAESWFDEYTSRFYQSIGINRGCIDFGDIRDILRIKSRKQKHSFKWFLEKFRPELELY